MDLCRASEAMSEQLKVISGQVAMPPSKKVNAVKTEKAKAVSNAAQISPQRIWKKLCALR